MKDGGKTYSFNLPISFKVLIPPLEYLSCKSCIAGNNSLPTTFPIRSLLLLIPSDSNSIPLKQRISNPNLEVPTLRNELVI
jgi:hypothetical protein